jgi:hypothetical protein
MRSICFLSRSRVETLVSLVLIILFIFSSLSFLYDVVPKQVRHSLSKISAIITYASITRKLETDSQRRSLYLVSLPGYRAAWGNSGTIMKKRRRFCMIQMKLFDVL